MNFAVIEHNKNQYKVEEGKSLDFPNFEYDEKKKKIDFDKVLLLEVDGKAEVGTPYIDNAKVSGEIVESYRSKKLRVFKFKPKKRYQRTYGQRQTFVTVKINKISK